MAAAYEVDPTMIHQWKKALLEGAAGIFERGGQAAATAEIAEETGRDLHAKTGELAIANDFLSRKLKPWTGKCIKAKMEQLETRQRQLEKDLARSPAPASTVRIHPRMADTYHDRIRSFDLSDGPVWVPPWHGSSPAPFVCGGRSAAVR
ncbi:hypothetical protein J2X53_004030 [Pseudorhodobacter sp. 4114]|nr:hypothetical protein [Pseudorhodobacter sp. 4114]